MNLSKILKTLLVAAFVTWGAPAFPHGDEDHGPPAATAPVSSQPRAIATSEDYEVVAIVKGDSLLIYVDRFSDNAPVTAARLTVTLGAVELRPTPTAEGVYKVHNEALLKPGRHDLIVAIEEGTKSDLLITTLSIGEPQQLSTPATVAPPSVLARLKSVLPKGLSQKISGVSWKQVGLVGGVLLGIVAGLTLLKRLLRRRRRAEPAEAPVAKSAEPDVRENQKDVPKLRAVAGSSTVAALLLLLFASNASKVLAHGDEDHGDAKQPIAVAGDAPRRLPDASVFLPKPSQRLIEVRTVQAKQDSTRPSRSFVGRIIADPNRYGVVQSTLGGRITAPEAGLPRLGQAVKAGDVLGFVAPYIAAIDRSDAAQTAGNLDQEIALAESRLDRAKRLFAVNAGTRAHVEELQIELDGLEKRRASLSNNTTKPEPLVAPIDGVIAATKVVTGQVVEPKDILYEIVDPSSLWVEALAFYQAEANSFEKASAIMQDGASLPLKFIGRSRALKQQSTVLNFAIENPSQALDIGMPVTVLVQDGEAVTGIVLPKTAIVRAQNGEDIVWQHKEPERFVATAVKTAALDGARVLVRGGLKAGERIVVTGAELINQVR